MAPLSLNNAKHRQSWSNVCHSETWQWFLNTQTKLLQLFLFNKFRIKITTWILKIVEFSPHFHLIFWIHHSDRFGQIAERFWILQIEMLGRVISNDPREHRVLGEIVVCPSSNGVELQIQHALASQKKLVRAILNAPLPASGNQSC